MLRISHNPGCLLNTFIKGEALQAASADLHTFDGLRNTRAHASIMLCSKPHNAVIHLPLLHVLSIGSHANRHRRQILTSCISRTPQVGVPRTSFSCFSNRVAASPSPAVTFSVRRLHFSGNNQNRICCRGDNPPSDF